MRFKSHQLLVHHLLTRTDKKKNEGNAREKEGHKWKLERGESWVNEHEHEQNAHIQEAADQARYLHENEAALFQSQRRVILVALWILLVKQGPTSENCRATIVVSVWIDAPDK